MRRGWGKLDGAAAAADDSWQAHPVSDATAKAPAKATAEAYLLIAVERVAEADVSTTRYAGTCLVDRYSLIKTLFRLSPPVDGLHGIAIFMGS